MIKYVYAAEPSARCRCAHRLIEHEHYRVGTSCAVCDCGRFRSERIPLIITLPAAVLLACAVYAVVLFEAGVFS